MRPRRPPPFGRAQPSPAGVPSSSPSTRSAPRVLLSVLAAGILLLLPLLALRGGTPPWDWDRDRDRDLVLGGDDGPLVPIVVAPLSTSRPTRGKSRGGTRTRSPTKSLSASSSSSSTVAEAEAATASTSTSAAGAATTRSPTATSPDDDEGPPHEDSEEDEAFELNSLQDEALEPNGCPFGWHSPQPSHAQCFHVSLVPMTPLDAETKCATLAATADTPLRSRGHLASMASVADQHFVCQILARSNSYRGRPGRLLFGLYRDAGGKLQWRDGSAVTSFAFWDPQYDMDLTHKLFMCNCDRGRGQWDGEPGNPSVPFVCSAAKDPAAGTAAAKRKGVFTPHWDVDENEEAPLWTRHWIPIAPLEPSTRSSCTNLEGTNLDIQHSVPSMGRLPTQITWLPSLRKKSSEPTRYYMVWQSKGWFGWLDFWTEYLTKSLDFVVAPVGKNVVVSRSASGRTGYTGVFLSPSAVERFSARVVLSRYPVPTSVLVHFPPGVLVNQLYVDPLIHVPLGDKLELVQVLDKFAQHVGCKHGAVDLGVIPESYDASTKAGCEALVRRLRRPTSAGGLWVVKGPRHGGAAVEVMASSVALKRFGTCEDEAVLKRKELVQRLVNPLLLDQRKFDVRVFVLVASTKPLLVFVHREPYFRLTMASSSSSSSTDEQSGVVGSKAQYVTNTHVQKKVALNSTGAIDWQDHIWTMDRIEEQAGKAGLDPRFWTKTVLPRIKRSVRLVMVASAHTLVERRDGQWKLFGVDFVLDQDLNPLLLDWNAFPGWDWSYRQPSTLKYRRKILSEAWKLVVDVQRGKSLDRELHEADSFKQQDGFELVYHGRD